MAAIVLKNVLVPSAGFAPGAGLNLEIQDREFVVLTGPPRSGVSRLLRMMAGLEETEGEILLDDRRVKSALPNNGDIAFVSKDYAPYPRMSVFDNLAFGLQRGKFPNPEIKKRVSAVAEMMSLQELLEREATLLGPEDRQRVALARAMALQPKTFLFDEPFSLLEAEARIRGRAEIKKLHQRLPAAIVYATHDPTDAMAMGVRMVVIDRGIVQQDG